MKKKQTGITLLEIMLVLAVGASIILLGIWQYQSFRRDSDIQQLKYNVSTIFQAMSFYYSANCNGRLNPVTNKIVPGVLNPNKTSAAIVPVDLNELITQGYFTTYSQGNVFPQSPFTGTTGPGYLGGYIAQFNQYEQERMVCQNTNTAVTAVDANDPNCHPVSMGLIENYTIQVAVLLADELLDDANTYLQLLGGDCLSSLSGNNVLPCAQSNNSGNYIVFEKLPSEVTANSAYGTNNYNIKQFNQEYTTYPIGTIIPTGEAPTQSTQYYQCNS